MSTSCKNNCNSHGTCINNKCSCDLGFFSTSANPDCLISGETVWGRFWTFFIVFFIILFLYSFLSSFYKLFQSLQREETHDCKNKCKRIILSPKNLSLLGICTISFIKVLWLSYDPLVFKGKSTRLIDRLLYETVYPIVFTVLASVLLVWASLYQCISLRAKTTFKYLKKFIVFLIIAVYPFSLVLSINKGLRAENSSWYWVGYASVAVGAGFLSFFFVIFSVLLFKYLHKGADSETGMEIEVFELKTEPKHTFMCVEDFSQNGSSDSIIAQGKTSEGFFKKQSNKRFFLDLTVDDKKLITKILMLTSIFGVCGLALIAVGTPFTLSDALNNPSFTMFGVFLEFSLEYGICLLIIFAFTRQISNPDKKNMKHMFYMARKNRTKIPEISISAEFSEISRRLRMYYN